MPKSFFTGIAGVAQNPSRWRVHWKKTASQCSSRFKWIASLGQGSMTQLSPPMWPRRPTFISHMDFSAATTTFALPIPHARGSLETSDLTTKQATSDAPSILGTTESS